MHPGARSKQLKLQGIVVELAKAWVCCVNDFKGESEVRLVRAVERLLDHQENHGMV